MGLSFILLVVVECLRILNSFYFEDLCSELWDFSKHFFMYLIIKSSVGSPGIVEFVRGFHRPVSRDFGMNFELSSLSANCEA